MNNAMKTIVYALLGIAAATQAQTGGAAPAPAPQYQDADQPVAWICDTGSRRWLQLQPCPASRQGAAPVTVHGIDNYGQVVHATGTVDVPVPVRQQPLTESQACDALSDSTLHIKHRGSSDVYERNKLKSRFCL